VLALDPTDLQLQIDPRVPAREIADLVCLAVVPTSLAVAAGAAGLRVTEEALYRWNWTEPGKR
jgi:hypothetical protein